MSARSGCAEWGGRNRWGGSARGLVHQKELPGRQPHRQQGHGTSIQGHLSRLTFNALLKVQAERAGAQREVAVATGKFWGCRHSVLLECLGKSIVQYLRVLVVAAVSITVQHVVVGERSVNITKIVSFFKFIKHGWLYF